MRLLLIEDEEGITIPLKAGLERRNYAVDVSDNGANGLRMALINQYDCILLDSNLPELDGLEVARRLRDKENKLPRAYAHVTSSQAVLRTAGYYIATLRAPFGRKLTSPR